MFTRVFSCSHTSLKPRNSIAAFPVRIQGFPSPPDEPFIIGIGVAVVLAPQPTHKIQVCHRNKKLSVRVTLLPGNAL